MKEVIDIAIRKGAKIFASISGGKDGQAMSRVLINNNIKIEAFIHADLGRTEWPQSMGMCQKIADEHSRPLIVVTRADGLDMLSYWERRMKALKGTGKPFWSSAKQRYCTSDLKRGPINNFFRNCGSDFIISAEGIRALESKARAKKQPLSIRMNISSAYYKGMTVEQAINAYKPGKRLALNWYPIFNYTTEEVWQTEGMTNEKLSEARRFYTSNYTVPSWWPFHPAYAMGNERVSCMLCVLGSLNDLQNGAYHNSSLLNEMIKLEEEGNATFKNGWSLKNIA